MWPEARDVSRQGGGIGGQQWSMYIFAHTHPRGNFRNNMCKNGQGPYAKNLDPIPFFGHSLTIPPPLFEKTENGRGNGERNMPVSKHC